MALLIDTGVVEAQNRVEFWANTSCDAYHPLRIRADVRGRFAARMWSESLASIGLFRVSASPNTMTRTREDIAAGDDETLHLSLLLRGTLHGTQRSPTGCRG